MDMGKEGRVTCVVQGALQVERRFLSERKSRDMVRSLIRAHLQQE